MPLYTISLSLRLRHGAGGKLYLLRMVKVLVTLCFISHLRFVTANYIVCIYRYVYKIYIFLVIP